MREIPKPTELDQMEKKYMRETRCFKTSRVFPTDVNNHNTLFGGKLMSYIDDIASITASKLCRVNTVTASTDSVDFLYPINPTDSVTLESFVSWTGRSSMEVFVKVIREDLKTGRRRLRRPHSLPLSLWMKITVNSLFLASFQRRKKRRNYTRLLQLGLPCGNNGGKKAKNSPTSSPLVIPGNKRTGHAI